MTDEFPPHGNFRARKPVFRAYRFSNKYYETLPRWIEDLRTREILTFIPRRSAPPQLAVWSGDGSQNILEIGDWIILDTTGYVSHMPDEQFRATYVPVTEGEK